MRNGGPASCTRRNGKIFGLGQLGRRLIVAFVGVALAAIVVDTVASARSLTADVSAVLAKERVSLTGSLALASGAAYRGGGWRQANLMPVMDLAGRSGAGVRLTTTGGRLVGTSPRFSALPSRDARSVPVLWHGRAVGRIAVRFSSGGLAALARHFEAQRWRVRLVSAAIAALIALIVSVFVARAISEPLERMLEAVRARGEGSRSVRIKEINGVGVVRELLASFNHASNALDEQERLRRDLVANVAHELRTPVAILQAGHEAMLDGVTALSAENVESLCEETVRLGQMIDGLQRLSAAESAALQLKLAEHDLADIGAEAAASLRSALGPAELSFAQRLRPVLVRCDAGRMREIVLNLLGNALKFTPPGGNVVLESGPAAGGGGWLKVTDSGIGIPAGELPHVTERFYRGLAAPGIAAGSGIGLAIVAELARAHGGEVRIASEPGHGTEVTVTVPG